MKIQLSILVIIFLLNIESSYCQWTKLPSKLNSELRDIKAVNDNNIYAAGRDDFFLGNGFKGGVFHSLDGGITWDTILTIDETTWMENIQIIDSSTIYVTHGGQSFYRTFDGGSNWEEINYDVNQGGGLCQAMDFINDSVGYVGNYSGEIFKTVNRGESWTRLFDYGGSIWYPIYELHCPSDSVCFAMVDHNSVSEQGRILKTLDAGQTWTAMPSGVAGHNNVRPNGLFSISEDTVIMVGQNMIWSIDGGNTWTTCVVDSQLIDIDFGDVQFIGNVGYAVGEQETILKSVDYGASWTTEYHIPQSIETLHGLDMIDTSNVIACSDHGNVYRKVPKISSVNQLSEVDDIDIFPNPYEKWIRINFHKQRSGKIIIYNCLGVLIKEIKVRKETELTVDLEEISADLIVQFIDAKTGASFSKIILH